MRRAPAVRARVDRGGPVGEGARAREADLPDARAEAERSFVAANVLRSAATLERDQTGSVRAVVLADTHLRDGRAGDLDARVLAAVADADLVLHAGDVTGRELLDHLASLAPVHAVLGNNDVGLGARLPAELALDLDGVRVAMVHDAGARAGRPGRMARRFPDAELVVFGHSHLPEDTVPGAGPRLFNPGSPTQRRRAPTRTFGVLEVRSGHVVDLHHVHLT